MKGEPVAYRLKSNIRAIKRKAALRRFGNGENQSSIARKLKVSLSTVCRWLGKKKIWKDSEKNAEPVVRQKAPKVSKEDLLACGIRMFLANRGIGIPEDTMTEAVSFGLLFSREVGNFKGCQNGK
jgi:hypothetical protein